MGTYALLGVLGVIFNIYGQQIKVIQKICQKSLKISKNILRTVVKTPAQTDERLKSYSQKTA